MSGKLGILRTIWYCTSCTRSMKHLSELVSRRRPSPCLKDLYLTFKFQGPEEITIFDPEAVVAMNGPGSNCTRADWYDGIAPLKSVANLRSPTVHDQRRRIWDKAFSANGRLQTTQISLANFSSCPRLRLSNHQVRRTAQSNHRCITWPPCQLV